MEQIITNSEKETFEYAKKFAQKLTKGIFITLTGDLGAGKTVFTKGLAAGLGIKKVVNSPTFVVMKIYNIEENKTTETKFQIRRLVHIDAYRLESSDDLASIGVQEYFSSPDTVCVIEWPTKIKKALPQDRLDFVFEIKGAQRIIKIKQSL